VDAQAIGEPHRASEKGDFGAVSKVNVNMESGREMFGQGGARRWTKF
jgi:hypothetical protein